MREDSDDETGARPRDFRRRSRWVKRWMRHTSMVPKGFLRYELLKKISEKPMSGSEIMNELENETNGFWKPSPGSIYPLLAWLQDQRYIKEADQTEPGTRRYTLTEEGKAFLETETKSREEINKHLEHFGRMWYGHREYDGETGEAARDLFKAVRELHRELRRERPENTTLEEAMKDLPAVTERIREITKKLQN